MSELTATSAAAGVTALKNEIKQPVPKTDFQLAVQKIIETYDAATSEQSHRKLNSGEVEWADRLEKQLETTIFARVQDQVAHGYSLERSFLEASDELPNTLLISRVTETVRRSFGLRLEK